jgi:hypothetical protein
MLLARVIASSVVLILVIIATRQHAVNMLAQQNHPRAIARSYYFLLFAWLCLSVLTFIWLTHFGALSVAIPVNLGLLFGAQTMMILVAYLGMRTAK